MTQQASTARAEQRPALGADWGKRASLDLARQQRKTRNHQAAPADTVFTGAGDRQLVDDLQAERRLEAQREGSGPRPERTVCRWPIAPASAWRCASTLPVITCGRGRSSSDQPLQTNSRDPGSGKREPETTQTNG